MTQSKHSIEAQHAEIEPVENSLGFTQRRCISPITMTLIASVTFALGYAAFQRIGTIANADMVEYTQNLSGGFLAVGMTKNQPGFIALSALDRDKVAVNADTNSNTLTGTHTVVTVQTPLETTHIRLRSPQVIIITLQGKVEKFNVDWTAKEFKALREAADCSHEAAVKKHRCGTPFTEIHDAIAGWSVDRVPYRVRAFLASFSDHQSHP